jgi:hypothetical protein
MTNVRRKTKNDSEETSDDAPTVNVDILISCVLDPKTGASHCKILHTNPVPDEKDDILERIELARKKDLEEITDEEDTVEQEAPKPKAKKSLKHDPKEEEDDEIEGEENEDGYNSDPSLDDTVELDDDDEVEYITKSVIRRRV